MKKITKKQFLADVMHEIDMLKLHASDGEKDRLNFHIFNPKHQRQCIYGQTTGDCESERAHELMDACCKRQMNMSGGTDIGATDLSNKTFSGIAKFINGDYKGDTWQHGYRTYRYLSVLEAYINLTGAKNEQIIAYIKGETDTLKLQ